MKPSAPTPKPTPSKKTKKDLFTLSSDDLAMVTGGQGVINTLPQK